MKIQKLVLILVSFSVATLFMACDSSNNAVDEAQEAGEELSEAFEQERKELSTEIGKLQENIEAKTQALRADLEDASEDAKEGINQQIAQLEEWGKELDNAAKSVGQDISNGWENVKSKTRKTLDDIDQEFEEAFSSTEQ